jgi:hypothetical protein
VLLIGNQAVKFRLLTLPAWVMPRLRGWFNAIPLRFLEKLLKGLLPELIHTFALQMDRQAGFEYEYDGIYLRE